MMQFPGDGNSIFHGSMYVLWLIRLFSNCLKRQSMLPENRLHLVQEWLYVAVGKWYRSRHKTATAWKLKKLLFELLDRR